MAITVVKVEDLESYVGKELGATDWFKIDQELSLIHISEPTRPY